MTLLENAPPAPPAAAPVIQTVGLGKTFKGGVRAVSDVDLVVGRGQTLGIVGESGCGKSTTARLILRLIDSDAGRVLVDGADVTGIRGRRLRALRSRVQFVPQNPRSSLNPKHTVARSISFPMRVQGVPRARREARVDELLEAVGLGPEFRDRYPHELSGGQLQRIAIARALSTNPEVIVCDEAVSALDKSVQAQVLNLLSDLQRDLGLTLVFISHDLAVVEHISDLIAVMYLGRVVEFGSAAELWNDPRHPYTKALLSAVPASGRNRIVLEGEIPSPSSPPSGCVFRTRCPIATERCAVEFPEAREISGHLDGPAHLAACHFADSPSASTHRPAPRPSQKAATA